VLALHLVRPHEPPVDTERELRLTGPLVAVHVAPQLHLPKGVLRPLLEHPHVHVLHVVLHQEHVDQKVRLFKPRHAVGVPDDFFVALVRQQGLEIEGEEEPGAPDAVAALGSLPVHGLGSAVEHGLGGVVHLRPQADAQHVAEVRLPRLVDVGRGRASVGARADGPSEEGLYHYADGAVVRNGDVACWVHGEKRTGAVVGAVLHGQGGDEVFPHGSRWDAPRGDGS
jgi:hypothetical protein